MEKPHQQINTVMTTLITSTAFPSDIYSFSAHAVREGQHIGDNVFIIIEGKMSLRNQHNHLLLVDVYGPYILNLIPDILSRTYIIGEESQFSYISYPRNVFYSHIDHHNLWPEIFDILSYSSIHLGEQLEIMKLRSLYEVVKYYLIKINSSDLLRDRENICTYIISRTGYSKSGVMTILKELKKGGYLGIANGKLRWLKTLPLKF